MTSSMEGSAGISNSETRFEDNAVPPSIGLFHRRCWENNAANLFVLTAISAKGDAYLVYRLM